MSLFDKAKNFFKKKVTNTAESAFEFASTADLRAKDSASFFSLGHEFSKLAHNESDMSVLDNVLKQGEPAFKTFGGNAGYMTGEIGSALKETLTKNFLHTKGATGAIAGAGMGLVAGVIAHGVDRWMNPLGNEDNGVINGMGVAAKTALVGALGGMAASYSVGAIKNIKNGFSSDIGKAAFEIGREGNIGAKAMSFAGRRLGGSISMGALALGTTAYIGSNILKSIISTNLTRPSNEGSAPQSMAGKALYHLV